MPLLIDPARAFLLPSQLLRLAEAVRDAGVHDESKWVEWKSTLPLGTAPARVHLVKQILGFVNRSPEVATRWAGGYAYLLVGVSPGKVLGVSSIDHNAMEQDLKPFIGPDLVWHPEYVKLDGHDVLIVVVDPPKHGDPIHYLRKPLLSPDGKTVHAEHTVFIRRNAQTVKADPDEWRMLQQRFAAMKNRLDVEVVAMQQSIERAVGFPESIEMRLGEHRDRLLQARYRGSERNRVLLDAFGVRSDPRSREGYEAEVEEYMEELKGCLASRLVGELARHTPAGLSLALVNRVDRPFRDVRVSVTVQTDSHLECIDSVDIGEDLPEFDPPRKPRPLGTPTEPFMLAQMRRQPDLSYLISSPRDNLSEMYRDWEVQKLPSGLLIEFDSVNLHPRETLQLPHLPLVVAAAPGTELTAEWSAAGLSADGELRGRLTIPVVPSTLKPLTGEELGEWGQEPTVLESEASAED